MTNKALNLPSTFEQSSAEINPLSADYSARLAQFVQPVEDTEKEIVDIFSRMAQRTGRAALLLGTTGLGKSTFIQSLTWRKHIGIARLISIDCSELDATNKLQALTAELQRHCREARDNQGVTAVSIDYLESLGGISDDEKRSFFQTLNGLLRKSPVFVIWPVTKEKDAKAMLTEAAAVSSTVFDVKTPILNFKGPKIESFPSIAKNTIAVFNNGAMLQSFLLTEAELDRIRDDLICDKNATPTIRRYIEKVNSHWAGKSGYLEKITSSIPKPNEVWCVFCHPTAEDVISTFAVKGNHHASAWTAYHAKLWEYIPGTQREAKWKNPTRLQYAIGGALTTRILYLSPQALISVCCSYGSDQKLESIKSDCPEKWMDKHVAKRHLETSALYRQLVGSPPSKGKTKGGPAAEARKEAVKPFETLNKLVTGSGNDRHVNRAIADGLRDKLPSDYLVTSEQLHPWIPNITPDIRIDKPDGTQICIEFCYTNNQKPGAVPDYVLDKLAVYMSQLEQFVGESF